MTSLLAGLIRLILLVVFTFAFMVLFQYGTTDYIANAQKELTHLQNWSLEYQKSKASAKSSDPSAQKPAEVDVALPER